MLNLNDASNDELLQEIRHRVRGGLIIVRVEAMMAGRGVLVSLMPSNPDYGHFSFGVEDLRKWVADRVL
jgi:hypothetical protein